MRTSSLVAEVVVTVASAGNGKDDRPHDARAALRRTFPAVDPRITLTLQILLVYPFDNLYTY